MDHEREGLVRGRTKQRGEGEGQNKLFASHEGKVFRYFNLPIAECRKTFKGFEYRGRVNRTRSGLACQRWDSQKPHLHHNRPSSKSDAALEHNFCRNPDGEAKPWCYTTSLKTRWDFCEIPFCDDGKIFQLLSYF